MQFSAGMNSMKLSLALAFAGAAALVACAHEQPAVNTASSSMPATTQQGYGVTSMQPSATPGVAEPVYAGDEATVAERLATARCDHEEHCGHVGAGRAFATLFDCVAQVRSGMTAELAGYGCPGALASAGVNQCMSTLTVESCQQSLNDLAHLAQCRSTAVCTISR